MKYKFPENIITKNDLKIFIQELADKNAIYHFEDRASDIINGSESKPLFTKKEAAIVQRLVNQSFALCEKCNIDIFGILLLHNRIAELKYFDTNPNEFQEWQKHHETEYKDINDAKTSVSQRLEDIFTKELKLHEALFPEIKVTVDIPSDFKDVSYVNDEFPSWHNEEKDLTIYICDVDGEGHKYQVSWDSTDQDAWFFSDDWNKILEFIAEYKRQKTTEDLLREFIPIFVKISKDEAKDGDGLFMDIATTRQKELLEFFLDQFDDIKDDLKHPTNQNKG